MSEIPSTHDLDWKAGVSRRIITPPSNVELAGLGYYLQRTSTSVRDDLTATGLVIEDKNGRCIGIVALDIMYGDDAFTKVIRDRVAARTNIQPEAICVNCSHSHNAPNAAFVRGVGEMNADYVKSTAHLAADALIQAWQQRAPAKLRVGRGEVKGWTINRTRENGPVDERLALLRVDAADGKPLAVAFNFHSHPTAHMEIDLRAVSRDWPGEVVDQLEAALPGATALFLQGTCGDINLRPEFNWTARRFEPAKAIAALALDAWKNSRPVNGTMAAAVREIDLPTRRWTREEIMLDRDEALHRLKTGDTQNWLNGFARVIVGKPERLPLRYGGSVEKAVAATSRFAVEWTEDMLKTLDTRPEYLRTEVQALRIGDVWMAANSSELFTTLGLRVRNDWPHDDLFMLGYSNGAIGYLPDAHDIERKTYAATQSPKFTGQFPFTAQSGDVMVEGMLDVLKRVTN